MALVEGCARGRRHPVPGHRGRCLVGIPGSGSGRSTRRSTRTTTSTTRRQPGLRARIAVLVAQDNVPRLQFEAARRAEQNPPQGRPATLVDRQVYADTTFAEVWRRELGGEIVTRNSGGRPTRRRCGRHVREANVSTWATSFSTASTLRRPAGGASIRGWIKSLEDSPRPTRRRDLHLRHGNPRFGVTGGRGDLLAMRDFLSAVMERVQRTSRRPRQAGGGRVENLPGFPDFNAPFRTGWDRCSGRLRRIDWAKS